MQYKKHYTFRFSDLDIETKHVEVLLGYREGEGPEPFPSIISNMLVSAEKYCSIEGGYIINNNGVIDFSSLSLQVGEVSFSPGKTILIQLQKSELFAFFTCTAGEGIGEWSKSLSGEGDALGGYITSIIGSLVVERAMDKIQHFLKEEMCENNFNITNRYSPGYCGWSVGEQQKLFKMFPDNFCNIKLTNSMMMDPIKSVSGIIGMGRDVKYNPYTCNLCESSNCLYKNLKK